MGDVYSTGSSPGGAFKQPTYGNTYGITDPYRGSEADAWTAQQQHIADSMNASMGGGGGRGGGGGGGGGGALQSDPSGDFYNPFTGSWNTSPAGSLAAEKQAFGEQKFNTIWGSLQGMLGNNKNPYTIGGDSGTGPEISVGGVQTPQQVQQQVNAARAKGDQGAATQNRVASAQLTGRGFGSQSPLLAALSGATFGQNMATNADTERNIRQTAAQQNAAHLLSTQQARESQYAARQQEQIARAQPYFQQQNALLAALANMAG